MIVVLRTAGDPLQLAREASGVVRLLDPDVPVYQIGTMQQHVSDAVGQPRFQTVLLALFAVAALFLAAVGIYGVVAHAAAQRTKEIGIRMALGADAARVVATVLADGLRPVAAGIVLGLGGAVALARLLSSVLFEVAPRDPAAFAGAGIMLALTAAAACLRASQARRASRSADRSARGVIGELRPRLARGMRGSSRSLPALSAAYRAARECCSPGL
jgi:putative ABC transport system permease protein